jgi:hypothetical protein
MSKSAIATAWLGSTVAIVLGLATMGVAVAMTLAHSASLTGAPGSLGFAVIRQTAALLFFWTMAAVMLAGGLVAALGAFVQVPDMDRGPDQLVPTVRRGRVPRHAGARPARIRCDRDARPSDRSAGRLRGQAGDEAASNVRLTARPARGHDPGGEQSSGSAWICRSARRHRAASAARGRTWSGAALRHAAPHGGPTRVRQPQRTRDQRPSAAAPLARSIGVGGAHMSGRIRASNAGDLVIHGTFALRRALAPLAPPLRPTELEARPPERRRAPRDDGEPTGRRPPARTGRP